MIIRFNSLIRTIYEKLVRILLLVFRKRIRLKYAEAHSELSHTSMMKLFCGNRYRLLTVNSFLKNAPLCLTGFLIRLYITVSLCIVLLFILRCLNCSYLLKKDCFSVMSFLCEKMLLEAAFLVTKWFDNHVLRTTLPLF